MHLFHPGAVRCLGKREGGGAAAITALFANEESEEVCGMKAQQIACSKTMLDMPQAEPDG